MDIMTIKDLKSITNFCKVNEECPVYVKVHYMGGTKERCYVQSFDSYSDGIELNLESNIQPIDRKWLEDELKKIQGFLKSEIETNAREMYAYDCIEKIIGKINKT